MHQQHQYALITNIVGQKNSQKLVLRNIITQKVLLLQNKL